MATGKPLRILVVNHRDWLNPRAGGVEEVLYHTTTRWAAAGHEVQLLVSSFPAASTATVECDGVKIRRIVREEYLNWALPLTWRKALREADVVVEHLSKVACLLPCFTRKPIVGYVHHLFGRSIFGCVPFPVAIYVRLMEKLAMRVYAGQHFMAVSESTAADLVRHGVGRERVAVVYNGVDLEVFRPGEKAADPLLLWVGRIRKTKCVDHVVEAFARIADRVPAARLVIVGRGEMEADLRRLIEQRGLTGRVQLTGYVQTDRLRELMQQAWVLAYPSPKEGWGLCVIEAAACGTPSVASNVPGLCESVSDGKTGFLVPHGDIGALAERIERLLTDPNQRSAMGMAARQWATGFSWERTAAESMAVLQRTVRREW